MQVAKVRPSVYTEDAKREGNRHPQAAGFPPIYRKGIAMLSLHKITTWMRGIIQRGEDFGLPEDVYNDVIPSGVHDYQHTEF